MLADDIHLIFEELLSDDEEDAMDVVESPRRPRVFRNRLDHFTLWSEIEFKNRFRLPRESVRLLMGHIEANLQRTTNRNHPISPLTQVLITLRYYATGLFLVVAGDFGGMHKSTASRIIRNVTQEIAMLLKGTFTECYRCYRLHSWGNDAENYHNRKGYFSYNVQTVADSHLRIRDIVARWTGATHEQTIFSHSRLKARFEEGTFGNSFLLGDSGYALSEYMMIPLENPQNQPESLYNESQIRTRNVVERLYGVWKRRFPILHLTLRLKRETTMAVIVATAVLHNIAVNMRNEEPHENVLVMLENFNQNIPHNQNRNLVRQELIEEYFQKFIIKLVRSQTLQDTTQLSRFKFSLLRYYVKGLKLLHHSIVLEIVWKFIFITFQ